jgi:hypothetical protein
MTLIIQKPTGAKLNLRKTWQPMDPDAATYITAVETADGQALEEKTKIAIDNFVLGCKADGIWTAIKASCILAGGRTLTGALVPLVGTAPTNVGPFASGDYNRKTGLVGDGSTKYLLTGVTADSNPQNNRHFACFASTIDSVSGAKTFMAARSSLGVGVDYMDFTGQLRVAISGSIATFTSALPGFIGASRNNSSSFIARFSSRNTETVNTSSALSNALFTIYARDQGTSGFAAHRLAFYSIGESLDLALLDARVTDLINAFAAAIP